MMKISFTSLACRWALAAGCFASVGSAAAADAIASGALTGEVVFATSNQSYPGRYSPDNQALSVEIDGLLYRGHYVARADDAAPAGGGVWGRAFLFASSASVLQCQLSAGFPQVSGVCQAADGRIFDLRQARHF